MTLLTVTERRVAIWALKSRLVLLCLQVVFNLVISDHQAGVFSSPVSAKESLGDKILIFLLGGFKRWDALYFLHVAEYGYTYENTLAFFPLYPVLVNTLGRILQAILKSVLSYHSILLFSGVFINIVCFTCTSIILYRLTKVLFNNKTFAIEAAILFSINPASVFFTACYSEALFSFLSFTGMLLLELHHYVPSLLFFALGSATRSNGLFLFGFLGYRILKEITTQYCSLKYSLFVMCRTTVTCIFFFLPYILFQVYAWNLYCVDKPTELPGHIINHATNQGYKIPGQSYSEWCNFTIPFSYNYIQRHYWDVGFLNYYTFRQIPNFILASPVIFLLLYIIFDYIKKNYKYCLCLGLKKFETKTFRAEDRNCFVYVVYTCALLIMCILFVHIQVTTRFMAASSPLLYWCFAIGKHTSNDDFTTDSWPDILRHLWKKNNFHRLVIIYFLTYYVIGTAMHVNFLPWT